MKSWMGKNWFPAAMAITVIVSSLSAMVTDWLALDFGWGVLS